MIVYCPLCSNPLACKCSSNIGSASKPCPLQKVPGGVWVHVMSDVAGNVSGMNVTCDGQSGVTDTHGIAHFDSLPAKTGTLVALGSLNGLSQTYSLPETKQRSVEVQDGNITYVSFELPRLGQLNVEFRDADTGDLLQTDGITLAAAGPTPKNGPAAKGVFTVDPAAGGEYKFTLTLASPVADAYSRPKQIDPATVAAGQSQTIVVRLPRRPAPQMKLDDPKVVIVHHAYHGQPKPGVPAHRLPVTLTASAPYDGVGEFSFPASLKVFDGNTALTSPVTVQSADLSAGKKLYIEADQPSAANKDTELKFELKNGSIDPLPAATEKITCVKLELEIYECAPQIPPKPPNPSAIGPKVAADKQADPGQPVPLQSPEATSKRAKLVLKQALPADFDGKIVLDLLSDSVALFADQQPASTDVALTGGALEFDNAALAGDKTFWVEGKKLSPALSDTGIRAGVKGVLEPSTGQMAEGDRATITVFQVALEMFRGGTVLKVAPFHASDFVAYLDVPLPPNEHNDDQSQRPPNSAFPLKSNYADNSDANNDKGVFRWRIKVTPDAIPDPQLLDVTVKVLASDGAPLDRVSAQKTLEGTAVHRDGMTVQLQKRGSEWESPYARIATAKADASSGADHCVVHSVPPYGTLNMDHGKQLGRKLRVIGSLAGAAFTQDWVMGGNPYAEIPIEFLYVADRATAIAGPKLQTARDKIYNLNQFWAAQGLEFKLRSPATPLTLKKSPPRTLISIGDFTGCANVADHPFSIEISIKNATVPLAVDVPKDLTPSEVADLILQAVGSSSIPTLSAEIYDDMQSPRTYLTPVAYPNKKPLDSLGARGPVDIELKGDHEITGIFIYHTGNRTQVDDTIDLYAPPTTRPFHDAIFAPVAASLRHWVRTYSPEIKDFVTVVVQEQNANGRQNTADRQIPNTAPNLGGFQHKMCEQNFCGLYDSAEDRMKDKFAEPLKSVTFEGRSAAYTLNMYGMWNDPRANLTLFVDETVFKPNKNDLQHEMGHVLGGLDHPLQVPEWFYQNEVVRSGSPQSEVLTHNTNHLIFVGAIENGEFFWKDLPKGHGGAIRDKIANDPVMQQWLVNSLANGQPSW